MRRSRGYALVSAIAFTLIIAMMIAGVLTYAMARRSNVAAKANSEAALLLAEAGVSEELSYIYRHFQGISTTTTPYAGAPVIATGEPRKGRKGSLPGVNGNYWVYTCADSGGVAAQDTAWSGKGPFWVIANARVGGAWRHVKVKSSVGGGGSPLQLYAVFGVNNSTTGSNNAITLSNANAVIEGTVGTNGKVTNNTSPDLTGNNWLLWTQAQNCNTVDGQIAGNQFVNTDQVNSGKPLYTQLGFKTFPTITKLMRDYFADQMAAGGYTDPWTYMAASNDNADIRMFSTTSPALSNAGTVSMGALVTDRVLFNGNNYNQSDLFEVSNGDKETFESVNAYTGTAIQLGPDAGTTDNKLLDDIENGDKCLIFPPGDYYFNRIELSYIAKQKIIIDDDWLTASNSANVGNPNREQIRFWIANGVNQNDFVEIPITFTSTGGGDPGIFRFMYNKSNQQFTFHRTSNFPDAYGNFTVYGAVYCVTGNTSQPTDIKFWGESQNTTLPIADRPYVKLRGSLIADKVTFQGYGYIRIRTIVE